MRERDDRAVVIEKREGLQSGELEPLNSTSLG
jgi:hypothetical protein